jgi:hypothetical protein
VEGGGRVEADHEVEVAVGEEVEVRGRVDAAVHVRVAGDLDGVIEARNGAGSRDRVSDVRDWSVGVTERDALRGGAVARDDPVAGVSGPAARNDPADDP